MKVLKTICFGIPYFIITTIIISVFIFAALLGCLFLQLFIFAKGDYLLFVGNDSNRIAITMIGISIVYAFFRLKEKFFNKKKKQAEIIEEDESLDNKHLNKLDKFLFKLLNMLLGFDKKVLKFSKIIKISYILILVGVIYHGMTSYGILYPESIKVGSPMVPNGIVYKYSDIKEVNVGISKHSKKSYSPYYNVIFNDGKSVNFFGETMQESKDIGFEYILLDLDEKLRNQGVVKNVNKEDFSKYADGLDPDFIGRVEKLFD